MQLITQLIFWAKPGNPRMERGRGGWEEGGQGRRKGEGGRDGGARAKSGNQLVIKYIMDSASCILGWGSEFRVNMLDSESVVVTAIASLQSCML